MSDMAEAGVVLRDGSRTLDPRLNRLKQFDEKSRSFPVTAVLPPKSRLRSLSWAAGSVLDQGQEGACVGFAWAKEAACNPVAVPRVDNALANSIYHECFLRDEFPDDVPYEGTSTIAGAKTMVARGYMTAYHWAFSIDQVLLALSTLGPVVIGINWYEGMYETRSEGLVSVEGDWVGGHCILLTGLWQQRPFVGQRRRVDVVEWTNSWGAEYGKRGRGYIPIADLERLLKDDGEACVPVGRRYPYLSR